MQTIIAISRGSGDVKYENYEKWLKKLMPECICIDLSVLPIAEALQKLQSSTGLLLTGGSDIHPARYGRPDAVDFCSCDAERDEREWAYVDTALSRGMPILGVCRGMQLLNVYFGGSLIVDMPNHKDGSADKENEIRIVDEQLRSIVGVSKGTVRCFHHQAVDALAPGFISFAQSPDGIVEAMGKSDAAHPFMLCVMWHPERMDSANPLSEKIGNAFLSASGAAQSIAIAHS